MAGYEVHGWMAAKILSLIALLTVSEVLAKESSAPPEQEQGKPLYFDVDKTKLHGMWYLGALRGLIKMKARASLQETSWIENTVYQQCERNAKSTVDLAKCAVRLFDARDYSRQFQSTQEKPKKAEKPVVNISVKKSVLKTTDSVLPVYTTNQHSKILTKKKKKHFYYKPGYGWVKNPVRSQARMRRTRRGTIDESWFLAEERRKQKRKIAESNKGKEESEDEPMRNIMGIKRLLGKESASRTKRKVEETTPVRGSTAAIDYSKLAANYLKNFIGKSDGISNLEKLRKINDYVDKSDKVKAYYKLMNDENQEVMNKYGIRSEDPQVEKDATDMLMNIVQIVNDFAAKKIPSGKLSIMSPRLFSLVPERQKSNRLMSPTIFSFHDDGFFSLPGILDILTSDKRHQQNLLNMMLDLSGASLALDQALDTLKKDIEDLDNVHYPLLQEMSRHDHNWIRAKRSFSDEQQDQYEKLGFTYLNKDQMDLMYANKKFTQSWGMNTTALAAMSLEEKDKWVESQIREIAAVGRPVWPLWNQSIRSRRQATEEGGPKAFVPVINEHHEGISVQTLEPIAFTNFINEGISLELITLSPRAFLGEILAPEALTVHTLSPRAFVATILSPSALMTRILTPGALRAEVLSPRALQAWILSPEALITEVLTPHFIEPRILSPEALIIFVLSPKFLSPNVLSPEMVGVVVLSPNILSPRIASEEKMLVEVLSPHILGGSHSHEEAHHSILEVGSHTEHSDEGHPHEHTEGHDEHGNAIQNALPHEAAHADIIQTLQQPLPLPGEDPVSQFFRNIG